MKRRTKKKQKLKFGSVQRREREREKEKTGRVKFNSTFMYKRKALRSEVFLILHSWTVSLFSRISTFYFNAMSCQVVVYLPCVNGALGEKARERKEGF